MKERKEMLACDIQVTAVKSEHVSADGWREFETAYAVKDGETVAELVERILGTMDRSPELTCGVGSDRIILRRIKR